MKTIHFIRQIINLFTRELGILASDASLLLLLFLGPVAYSFLYTSIFVNKMERDIPVLVIDNDRSARSRELVRHLDAHEMIQVSEEHVTQDVATQYIQSFKYFAVITIPEGYERKIISAQQVRLSVVVNTSRFLISNDVMKGVNDAVGNINEALLINRLQKKGMPTESAQSFVKPIVLISKSLFNTTESYGDFIIIALLALILQQSLLIISAASIAHENEKHSIKELLHKVSGSPLLFFTGKMGIYFIVFSLYAAFFTTFHFYIYKLPFTGSVPALIMLIFFTFMALMATGAVIGSFFPTKFSALIVIVFSSYPLFLLSGYSWPINAFPHFLQIIAYCIPHTWFFSGFACITQQGGSFSDILPQLTAEIIIMLVMMILLMLRMYYLRKRVHPYHSNT